jgi:acyl transferase domain-containing protein
MAFEEIIMNIAAPNPAPKGDDPPVSDLDVAIIGMAGRFPGAGNIEEFWRNLCAGVDSTTVLSADDLRAAVAAYDPLNAPFAAREMEDPNYVRAKPLLDGIDQFDAAFFG